MLWSRIKLLNNINNISQIVQNGVAINDQNEIAKVFIKPLLH